MTPFRTMTFRALVKQFLVWVGFNTTSFSSGTFTLRFNNDGTVDLPSGASSYWLNKTPDTSAASLYEIRWTSASGGMTESTSLTQNVWYALSTNRSFSIIGTQEPSSQTSSFTIAIRLASEGGNGTSAVWQHTLEGSA